MFGPGGFRSRLDFAGVVLNRWGHAYFAPGPGFFFGRNGEGSPAAVLRRPHGRVAFAHSELQGNMNAAHAMLEGRRAAREIMQMI
jgi:spermidine dehydrogenase